MSKSMWRRRGEIRGRSETERDKKGGREGAMKRLTPVARFPIMTKGGVKLDILMNATTRRDEEKRIVGVIGIGQDITAFKM